MNDAEGLRDTVTRAIDEWLASNGGGMAAGFVLALNYYDADGDQCWAVAHPEQQTPAHTLGLLRWHTLSAEHDINAYLSEEDE